MICEKCGEPIAQDALYCENCGARAALQADAAQNAAQARSASARKSMPLDEGGSPEQENPASEDAARPGRKRRRAKREKMPPADPPIPPEDMIPLTTGQCVGILLALCVPVLNLVLMLKWAYAARATRADGAGACGTDPHGRVYRGIHRGAGGRYLCGVHGTGICGRCGLSMLRAGEKEHSEE
ncbi:MAG: zinc-ribbon domain-containing protein [Ruthenibacterium lactatiformans]